MPKRKRNIIVSYELHAPDLQLQPSLFAPLAPIVFQPGSNLTIEERFQNFDSANPHIYQLIERMAIDLAIRGHRRIGIKMIWETLRYRYAVQSTGDGDDAYHLNNIYTSRYARKLTQQHPDLAARIELRELKAE